MTGGGLFLKLQPNSTYLINSDHSLFYTIFLFLEILFIFLNISVIILMQYLAYTKPCAHKNMVIIVSIWVLAFVPMSLFRLWFIYMIIVVKNVVELMALQSSVRTFFINMMILCLPTALMERTFAAYYLKDYEKKPRRHVILISLCFTALLFLTLVWDIFEESVNILFFCVEVFVIAAFSELWFILLWRYNHQKLKASKECPLQYTLSTRFQIEENMRVLKLGIAGFIVISLIIGLLIALILVVTYHRNPTVVLTIQLFIEFSMSSGMMVVYISFIFVVPDWRHFVFRLFKRNIVKNFKGDTKLSEKAQETYFKQLAKSWT